MIPEEFIGVQPAQGFDADHLASKIIKFIKKVGITQRCALAKSKVEHL